MSDPGPFRLGHPTRLEQRQLQALRFDRPRLQNFSSHHQPLQLALKRRRNDSSPASPACPRAHLHFPIQPQSRTGGQGLCPQQATALHVRTTSPSEEGPVGCFGCSREGLVESTSISPIPRPVSSVNMAELASQSSFPVSLDPPPASQIRNVSRTQSAPLKLGALPQQQQSKELKGRSLLIVLLSQENK